jgi:hypothetical protein
VHYNAKIAPQRKEAQMDSLDKIIADMESEIVVIKDSQSITVACVHINDYLTRLKALRELTDKKEEDESK